MIKLIFGMLVVLSSSAFAVPQSSIINLPVPNNGVISPKGGEIGVPVSGQLIDAIQYNVTCHVSNPNGADGIMLRLGTVGTYCTNWGGCGGIEVNGNIPSSNQVNLTEPDNSIQFKKVMTANYDPKGSLIFQNLDNTASAVVSNCSAIPSVN